MSDKPPTRDERESWTLVLKDEPGHHDSPTDIRLRRCLKDMLRRFGIRVVSIGPAAEPDRERP